jgi:hypothetical protein
VNQLKKLKTAARWAIPVTVLVTLILAFFMSIAPNAKAAAFTYNVYAPNRSGNTLTSWANLSRDCSGTYGCWNYMKIEKSDWWWYDYVGGNWVSNNGWNSISVGLPSGCGNYRTTVDSYNDVLISQGIGVNLGQVGVNASGQAIYRFRTTWSSGTHYYCR